MDEMIGKKFGRLTVVGALPVERYENGKPKHLKYMCECECGNTHTPRKDHLISGACESCGCLRKEAHTTHGMSGDPLYQLWSGIRSRILDPANDNYFRYGGRGLTMESDWINNFPAFREWMLESLGPKPTPDHSLDRVKNELGYLKNNLRWATMVEQGNNRRGNRVMTYQGVIATMKQHSDRLGLRYSAVKDRIGRYGWTVAEALGTPTDGDRSKRRPKVEEPQAA